MMHILWDWNGTLLDDTEAALGALNDILMRRGLHPLTMAFYRDRFSFPVKPFYAEAGVDLAKEDWHALACEYHACYAARPKKLNVEAIAALEQVKATGARQSVLSALRQDLLEEAVVAHGVAPYMDWVYGVDNLDGATKLERARELVARTGVEGLVVIGDALHDKEVADAFGVRCVLCAQGGHSFERLRKVAPTGRTLLESVRLALGEGLKG